MDIFTLLKNLFCNERIDWISEIEDNQIQPFVIQKWLSMSSKTIQYAKWLDKYTFHLPPKMYLMLAWSIIPKQTKPPFIRYIKKKDEDDSMYEVWLKIRKALELSDNDFKYSEKRLRKYIEENKIDVFRSLGISKKVWRKHKLDFKEISVGEKRRGKSGLELWGM